jgi:Uma2 family endonuclease
MSHRALTDGSTKTLTLADWAALDEDEEGELVDGHIEEEEVPDWIHETVVVWLASLLRAWAAPRGGFVAGSEIKYAVGPRRGRKPDLSAFFPGGKVPPRRGLVRIPPDLVVEVVTPTPRDGRRDRVEKTADYASFGVRWYWIVDPELRSFEVLELAADGRYAHALGATDGTIDRVPGCEGLSIDLDSLWAEIDRLAAAEE